MPKGTSYKSNTPKKNMARFKARLEETPRIPGKSRRRRKRQSRSGSSHNSEHL